MRRTPPEAIVYGDVYFQAKKNAAKAGISFEMTRAEVQAVCALPCNYCGDMKVRTKHGHRVKCSGMDRVDNNCGYVRTNVVPCCSTCNRAKSNLGVKEFGDWIWGLVRKTLTEELRKIREYN